MKNPTVHVHLRSLSLNPRVLDRRRSMCHLIYGLQQSFITSKNKGPPIFEVHRRDETCVFLIHLIKGTQSFQKPQCIRVPLFTLTNLELYEESTVETPPLVLHRREGDTSGPRKTERDIFRERHNYEGPPSPNLPVMY